MRWQSSQESKHWMNMLLPPFLHSQMCNINDHSVISTLICQVKPLHQNFKWCASVLQRPAVFLSWAKYNWLNLCCSGDEHFPEALQLVKEQKLYSEALRLYTADRPHYKVQTHMLLTFFTHKLLQFVVTTFECQIFTLSKDIPIGPITLKWEISWQ